MSALVEWRAVRHIQGVSRDTSRSSLVLTSNDLPSAVRSVRLFCIFRLFTDTYLDRYYLHFDLPAWRYYQRPMDVFRPDYSSGDKRSRRSYAQPGMNTNSMPPFTGTDEVHEQHHLKRSASQRGKQHSGHRSSGIRILRHNGVAMVCSCKSDRELLVPSLYVVSYRSAAHINNGLMV